MTEHQEQVTAPCPPSLTQVGLCHPLHPTQAVRKTKIYTTKVKLPQELSVQYTGTSTQVNNSIRWVICLSTCGEVRNPFNGYH